MEAGAEITFEQHGVCSRGGEIIRATHFPAEASRRILVRTIGCVTSYLGPNFVSSRYPRKPHLFVAIVRMSLPQKHIKHQFPTHALVSRRTCSCFVNDTAARCAGVSSFFGVCAGESGSGPPDGCFFVTLLKAVHWPRFCNSCNVPKLGTRLMLAQACFSKMPGSSSYILP